MRYYLAYGSSLNIEQMAWRCPGAKPVDTALIKDWRLSFKGSKTGSYLTIDKCKGYEVPVAVWGVTEAHEAALDRYEGYPIFYYKRDFVLTFNQSGERHRCFAYIMRDDASYGVPSSNYYLGCLDGYKHFKFDENILVDALVFSERRCWYEAV